MLPRNRLDPSSVRICLYECLFKDGVGGGGCKHPIDQEREKEGREGSKFFEC